MDDESFQRLRPDGDEHDRLTCTRCGFIAYENPKIVAGAIVEVEDGVLLCRRAIEPRSGFWTLPAGYMELGETVEEAACREAWEEARVRIVLDGLLAVYSIARIGQVQVLFRARLAAPGWEAGPESLEVRAFPWNDIPWDELAFPSARWALQHWYGTRGKPLGCPATNPPEDSRGTMPLPGGAT
jgi:ADP-ribose pyrophosphatase YjhB (NUDIX family)